MIFLKLDWFSIEEHVSRLKILGNVYEQERDSFKVTIASEYQIATTCHQKEKQTLLSTISNLQSHYRDSYQAQKSHFQIRKDDIINQVYELSHVIGCVYQP